VKPRRSKARAIFAVWFRRRLGRLRLAAKPGDGKGNSTMEQPIYTDKRADGSRLQRMSSSSISGYHPTPESISHHLPSAPAVRSRVSTEPPPSYLFVKRLVDIVAASLFLLIGLVPMLLIGLCIALESRGPIIHKRRVLAVQDWDESMGSNALQTFDAYKLRTMVPNADEVLRRNPRLMAAYAKDWKLENDPRITRLGRFLRTTSIDEFPQLLNVLRGEMTLIGPRMITVPELDRYGADASRLLKVKSGLTGLWQVSGRQNVAYEERVRLDMIYINSRTFAFDCCILFKTIKCVLLRQGAY